MSRPTPNDHRDDPEIRGWIAEAGDIRVETRLEHVEQVRQLLLERVVIPREEVVIPRDEFDGPPIGIGLIRLLAVAGLAAAILFGAVYLVTRPSDDWALVAQALHEKTWIHVVASGFDGLDEESWISPRFELLARKHLRGAELWDAEFHDVERGIKDEYIAEQNTIYRDPFDDGRRKRRAQEIEVFRQLLHLEEFKVSPLPDTEIIRQSHRVIIEGGKVSKVYDLTLRRTIGPKSDVKMVIRVDPKTGLPRTWDIEVDDGTLKQTFDYPAAGPADILALGVPATAKREDNLPEQTPDLVLNQVLTGLKVGRERFDDYCGYVWTESESPADLRRVWRKGRKWRVENVHPRITPGDAIGAPDRIPIDIDLAGMKRREADLIFELQSVCDGQTIWIYQYKPKSVVPDRPYVSEQASVSVQQTYAAPDSLNFLWPDLMPELLGHPNAEGPARFWDHALDLKPSDGPPGTVCLRTRETQYQDPNRPDRFRLWIDPEKNYLALRSEISVFEVSQQQANIRMPAKLAHVETRILTDLARSPSGFWYPTRVLRSGSWYPTGVPRKTSGSKVDQVTRFLMDFDAPLPDDLFQPKK